MLLKKESIISKNMNKAEQEKVLSKLQTLLEQLSFLEDSSCNSLYKMEHLRDLAPDISFTVYEIQKLVERLMDKNLALAMGIYYEAKYRAEQGDEKALAIYEDLKPYFHLALGDFITKQ